MAVTKTKNTVQFAMVDNGNKTFVETISQIYYDDTEDTDLPIVSRKQTSPIDVSLHGPVEIDIDGNSITLSELVAYCKRFGEIAEGL